LPAHINQPVGELKELIDKWDFHNDGDIIGYIYQALECQSNLKKKGQFFTPGDIVAHIIDHSIESIDIEAARILDPACGSGQFLIYLYKRILDFYLARGLKEKDAARRIIKDNIFGIDIDPIAVMIAKFNLSKLSGCRPEEINIYCFDFLYQDLLGITEGSISKKPFDLIAGNPPWRSKFSVEEKRYFRKHYQSIKSGMNTFTLFIERSIDYIKDNGTVSFLIPCIMQERHPEYTLLTTQYYLTIHKP
jgi:adenine-specific DNA-methyltransferase